MYLLKESIDKKGAAFKWGNYLVKQTAFWIHNYFQYKFIHFNNKKKITTFQVYKNISYKEHVEKVGGNTPTAI